MEMIYHYGYYLFYIYCDIYFNLVLITSRSVIMMNERYNKRMAYVHQNFEITYIMYTKVQSIMVIIVIEIHTIYVIKRAKLVSTSINIARVILITSMLTNLIFGMYFYTNCKSNSNTHIFYCKLDRNRLVILLMVQVLFSHLQAAKLLLDLLLLLLLTLIKYFNFYYHMVYFIWHVDGGLYLFGWYLVWLFVLNIRNDLHWHSLDFQASFGGVIWKIFIIFLGRYLISRLTFSILFLCLFA